MDVPDELKEVLTEGRTVRLVDDHIFSVLPDEAREHHYDKRAFVYDLIVRARLYNEVMWGSSPLDYASFARRAAASSPGGKFLDAGCGSIVEGNIGQDFGSGCKLQDTGEHGFCDNRFVLMRGGARSVNQSR